MENETTPPEEQIKALGPFVEAYREKHGAEIERLLIEKYNQIRQDSDGDSLLFFHQQLVQMALIVQQDVKDAKIITRDDMS